MTTLLDHFRELLAYDRWANDLALRSIDSIPADRRSGKAYDRLRALVPHNLIARRVWRWRIRGDAYENPTTWFPALTEEETRAIIAEVEPEWDDFLASLTDADLGRTVEFRTSDGTPHTGVIRHLLTHVFNHATYHRGQIARLVTEHGGRRADTDFFLFLPGRAK